jgi:signal transduction histidine kinase/HAMP domain-containing protein
MDERGAVGYDAWSGSHSETMIFEWWLSGSPQIPILPAQIIWTVLLSIAFAYAAANAFPLRRRWDFSLFLRVLIALMITIPLSGMVILKITAFPPASIPGLPLTPVLPVAGLVIIAWFILAGSFLGAFPALLIGLTAGFVRAVWGSHEIATALEYALVAWFISSCLRQNYSGSFFSILRKPWVAAGMAGAFLVALRFGSDAASAAGNAVAMFDYAAGRLPSQTLTVLIEMGFGAGIGETLRLSLRDRWPSPGYLRPTVYHQTIAWKIGLWLAVPLLVMAVTLTATVVLEAREQARSALEQKMRDTARTVRNTLPVAITMGHSLIESMAAEAPSASATENTWRDFLEARLSSPPFFSQLIFLPAPTGTKGVFYPSSSRPACQQADEWKGCQLALQGIAWDGWVISSPTAETWLSFAQPVKDSSGRMVGVLLGRTSVESNPMLMAIPKAFAELENGDAILADADGRVVFPSGSQSWQAGTITKRDADGAVWRTGVLPGGGDALDYQLPLGYPNITVSMRLPEAMTLRIALENGLPVGLMALIAIAVTEVLAILIAQQIIFPLRQLALTAGQIAAGDWERSISVAGEDEIGLLGGALEAMRRNLWRQMRQEELLLKASQGMATIQDLAQWAEVVLRSAKSATGADGLRLVLVPALRDRVAEEEILLGSLGRVLKAAEDGVLDRVSENGVWTGNRQTEPGDNLFDRLPGTIRGMIILRIARGNKLFGALCIAYRDVQAFEMSALEVLTGLANQAAMSIANLSLLESTEGERQRLAAILEAVPEGLAVTDADGRLLYANTAFCKLLTISQLAYDQPLSKTISDPHIVEFLLQQSIQPVNRDFNGPNGVALQAVVHSVRSADGAAVWQVSVLQDVTRLRALGEMKSEFVHTVSHDLRRPLTTMDGLANMMEMMGPLNPAQKEYIHRIRHLAQTMQRLVTDLLDLGRMEQDAGLRRSNVNLKEILAHVVEECKTESASAGIQVTLEIPEDLPNIIADPSLLERAVGNLVENGIRFNHAGGIVRVVCQCGERDITIAVKDTGNGIAPADQPHIFEKFYRGTSHDKPDEAAWGLGLAIVKRIVEWHHGKVWFESKLGQGSAFFLSLPFRG